MIAARMRKPNGRGSWMVHKDCDLDYAEQVTAEHKVTERVNGKVVQKWVPKTTHADNHYLDCEVYAAAAADMQGVRIPLPAKPRAGEAKKSRSLRRHRRKIGSGKMKAGYKTEDKMENTQMKPSGNAGAGK